MTQVNMLEAKSNLSALIRLLEQGSEDCVAIARNGKPVALLTLIKTEESHKRIGVAKGVDIMADGWDLDDADTEIAALFGVI